MLHSSNPGLMMPSTLEEGVQNNGRRSSSRSSASASPTPLHCYTRRNSSVSLSESLTSNNSNENSINASSGALPLTKNVGVSVNFGKSNVKSNSSSTTAGSQHISNGQQHEHQQQQTPGASTSLVSHNGRSNDNCNNRGSNSNSSAINLGNGHIGAIVGPMMSSAVGSSLSSSSTSVNQNSSLSTSPAVNAPTTCANKGVPSAQCNQEQHLSIHSPQPHSTQMSPHSPSPPMSSDEMLEPESVAEEDCKNGNSSSSNSTTSSRNGGSSSNNKCSNSGPISPTSSISSSSSGGTKGDTQSNDASTKTSSNGGCGSSKSNTNTNRIVSQNVNGTLAITGVPKNESELQLFRVLQRANLLNYFDMMIELGGDDVQQLCDAGEDEFLEIMALIGMASKPLHVRRLQKALQEWMTQPSLFQAPVLPPGHSSYVDPQLQQAFPHLSAAATAGLGHVPLSSPHMTSYPTLAGLQPLLLPGATGLIPTPTPTPPFSDLKASPISSSKIPNQMEPNGIHQIASNKLGNSPSQASNNNSLTNSMTIDPSGGLGVRAVTPQLTTMLSHYISGNNNNLNQQHQSRYNHHSHSSGQHTSRKNNSSPTTGLEKGGSGPFPVSLSDIKIPADQIIPSHFLETRIRTRSEASSPASSFPGSPHPESRNSDSPVTNSLQEHEIQKLAESAIRLIRSLPPSVAEPKFSTKRKTSGDYELILRLCESDPRRMDEIRRVAAVYGRADAKRKTVKPLSMHELAINEAASQLCKHVPALLTKRDELLSLSRQVLRESGLPYAAVSSTFSISILTNNLLSNNSSSSNIKNSSSSNNNNNNDINTKSKYEEIYGLNRQPSSSTSHSHKNDSVVSPNGNYNIFGGFHGKRFRLDGSSAGIEIQEYNSGRPISTHGSPSSPSSSNGMLITELRNLPPRRSPSDEDHYLPTPLELVTVTSSDLRKSGGGNENSKAFSVSSIESRSPPIRKPMSVELSDLSGSNHRQTHGTRMSQTLSNNVPSSIKITSIPVSGGSISIMNHNGIANLSPSSTSANHLFSQHFTHHHHHQYNGNTHHNGIKIMPIKSEPTVN